MYKMFRIKNFRCFKDLQINDLGRGEFDCGAEQHGQDGSIGGDVFAYATLTWSAVESTAVRGIDFSNDDRMRSWRQFFYRMDPGKTIEIEGHHLLPKPRPTLCIKELANTQR